MTKLELEDIRLKTVGEQIKDAIFSRGYTLEEFADEIDIYLVSLKQYLRRKNGGSATFKIKITSFLDVSYDEIVKSPEEQLRELNRVITRDIFNYYGDEDMDILNKMKDYMLDFDLRDQLPTLYRNFGVYYFFKNDINKSIEYYELSIDVSKSHGNLEMDAIINSEMGLLYYYKYDYKNSKSYYKKVDAILYDKCGDISSKTIFNHFIRKARLDIAMKKPKHSYRNLIIAKDYVYRPKMDGYLDLYWGQSQVLENNYVGAKKYFERAMKNFEGHNIQKSLVYNAIAKMYMKRKDYDKAQEYIERAMNYSKNMSYFFEYNYTDTYTLIKSKVGKLETILEEVHSSVINQDFSSEKSIVEIYKNIVSNISIKQMKSTDKIMEYLIMTIQEAQEYFDDKNVNDLKICLGELIIKIRSI